MKTVKFNKIFFSLLLLVAITTSCVKDDDWDTPTTTITEPVLDGDVISISAVLGVLEQQGGEQFTFQQTNDYMEGYVISSDEGGNFFREIIIQDKPENPTAGIKVALFVNPLFTRYEIGRKIYIQLDGFTVGVSNGVATLGIPDGNYMQEAPATFENKIVRSATVEEIVPLEVEISDFSDEYENLFIKLNNMQFPAEIALGDNSLTFAAEDNDDYDAERRLESCENDNTTTLSTSTFADFRFMTLPEGSGEIFGVLTRTYEDDMYVISINDPSDINFDGERCDPVVVDCGLANEQGQQNIFNEDFESQSNGSAISGNGWTNYAEEGTNPWEAFNDSENNPSMGRGAKVDPYQSDDTSTISWLITPVIDFDAQDGETLRFKTSNSFADESNMRVLFSSDWDGTEENISSATWNSLSSATIVTDDDFYQDVIDSGIVDMSCIEGTGYIAFKYIGSGQGAADGTYELDDVSIDF